MTKLSFHLALLFVATICLASCSRGRDSDPIRYTHVSSISIGSDAGEAFGIVVKSGILYVSDGADGVVREVVPDGPITVLASGLRTPSGLAFLPDGDLVVADTGSHTIRKISADGKAEIIAGIDGTSGSKDGPATSATFNGPVGIAVSADGSIFVSDTYNDRIRVIHDGVVTTIAGERRGFADGVGTSASFDTPLGIAIRDDKILVADSGNARIRVVEKNGVVATLSGSDDRDRIDGSLVSARFVNPTAVTVDPSGAIFVADEDAIRVIGRRIFPTVETIAGDQRGYADGDVRRARFSRPSGLAIGADHAIYVADSDHRLVRIITNGFQNLAERRPPLVEADQPPFATRWPFDPPSNPREVAGTLGEIRGDLKPNGKPVWYHNGLDIAGAYGETAKFIRDETVLDPHSAENFGTTRELLRLPLIGYIHLRLGRDKEDRPFGDQRFQFERDAAGKIVGVRVPRGARFSGGDAIGTLNAMNHVHLIAGRVGEEINALSALDLPGIGDTIAPTIEDASLFTQDWQKLSGSSPIKVADRMRIVVRAYDRMDGNSERRRLGVYRIGYQLLSNGAPLGEVEWRISFARSPSNETVRLAYAEGSRSGYTPDTVFNYIATNRVDGENAREDFLDTSNLAPGKYVLRVFAADYFGNTTSKDVDVVK